MTQIPEKDIIHQILEHPNAQSFYSRGGKKTKTSVL